MSSLLEIIPVNYKEIDSETVPFALSARVLSPVVKIFRYKGRYTALLGGYVVKNNERIYAPCLTNEHNWIFDDNTIKPLPYDVTIEMEKSLRGLCPDELSYSQVLSVYGRGIDGFDLIIDGDIFEKANTSSLKMCLEEPIAGLTATLYPYQSSGVAWMADTLDAVGGLILADEMGLGKTIQILSLFLRSDLGRDCPALIVCPTTLIANWAREIETFSPSLTYMIHRGKNRTGYYKDLYGAHITITTYDTLVNDLSMLKGVDWKYFVCDEAQALKNPDSQRRVAASEIDSLYTIPVTGTPMENSLVDLWSLCDLAIPGVLGSRNQFTTNFPDNEDSAESLSYLVDPIILKRQVCDVANDLPERTDIDLPVEMDSYGKNEYENIRQEALDTYGVAGGLVAISQLSVYCAHPWLRVANQGFSGWEDSVEKISNPKAPFLTPKMELCVELLKEAYFNNKKVLVFSIYNRCGQLIQDACSDAGIRFKFWGSINGTTPQENRQQLVDDFSTYEGPAVLVLNPKAAGSGLNITAATIVIHYTQNWNPALEKQASARAHRRGQTFPVMIYRLYYSDTVEETMINRSKWKRILGNKAIPISSRDNEDLQNALSVTPEGKE